MTRILAFVDTDRARWARFEMADGDPCWVGIAATGILVKRSKVGLFGRKIYEQRNLEKAAYLMGALDEAYPFDATPADLSSPVLQPIANAILHCQSLAEVREVLDAKSM